MNRMWCWGTIEKSKYTVMNAYLPTQVLISLFWAFFFLTHLCLLHSTSINAWWQRTFLFKEWDSLFVFTFSSSSKLSRAHCSVRGKPILFFLSQIITHISSKLFMMIHLRRSRAWVVCSESVADSKSSAHVLLLPRDSAAHWIKWNYLYMKICLYIVSMLYIVSIYCIKILRVLAIIRQIKVMNSVSTSYLLMD